MRRAILAMAVLAASAQAAPMCGWPDPGADRYRGDPAEAVLKLTEIPDAERMLLADMVRQGYGWRRVMVGRDQIDGGRLVDLRQMNFGAGRICQGEVDRRSWTNGRNEAAKGYSVGRWTVLHFDSCNNVAVTTDTLALQQPAAPTREGMRAARSVPFAAPGGTVNAVPEPSTLWLVLMAVVALAMAHRGGRL